VTYPLERDLLAGRAYLERRTIHVAGTEEAVRQQFPLLPGPDGPQARLAIPLQREGAPFGVLMALRRGPEPFSDKHLALLETFADQAVIAIENTRLFEELQASNATLREALEQQTAVAGVLQAISRSAFDLEAVLSRLAEDAARLCGAPWAAVWRRDGAEFRRVAVYGPSEDELGGVPIVTSSEHNDLFGRLIHERRAVAVVRRADEPELGRRYPAYRTFLNRIGGVLSALMVPLLKDDEVIGALDIGIPGAERHFADREIALVQTFADQAVIAIENARLFDALKHKSEELEVAGRAKDDFLSRMSHTSCARP
jgi:two-component system, NtrC family, sensor kinase